ncbi:MAG: hypothetical protein EOO77_37460 [Oxalobacteraceae bacterium]|nr:MAG: hypothetical protein EOO77_37460 [Oxalobacteraceae bacterium]
MRIVRIEDATVEWLEAFYAGFGGVASHMPRTVAESQRYFLGEALGFSISEVRIQPKHNYINIEARDALDGQTLRLLIATLIVCEGRTYTFHAIEAEIDRSFPDGETPDRWLEISFRPV